MVSPAVQGQVPHPSIVPEFLRSTSCGMTSARGHGAIVYCLNSGSEGKRRRKVGRGGRGDRERERTKGRKKVGRGERKKTGENGRKESGIGVKKTMNAGGVENGI
ncbi:hypothetical protein TNCV_1608271 [Trichonephila clavipes]|nr:hypothetical protein TNCV_1608271 [Trichonephila clavipes]